jgi:Xaa-Pro aminopeptidase
MEGKAMNNRLKRVAESLEEKELDAVLIMKPSNLFYLTGFTGAAVYLFISRDEAILLTDSRYTQQAKLECPEIKTIEYSAAAPYFAIAAGFGFKKIGFEEGYLSYSSVMSNRQTMGFAEWLPFGSLLSEMRAVKDATELNFLREAARISDKSFVETLNFIKQGKTEKQVAEFLFQRMVDNGADHHLTFDIIVGSGSRSAMSHSVATNKVLEPGDMVVIDFGCQYQRYTTDCTRTVVIGKADDEQKAVYNHVHKAQSLALTQMKAGMTSAQAHRITNEYFAGVGFENHCGNTLGHGIGLFVDDVPLLIDLVQFFGETTLLPGMVVTVEPGIYLMDRFGVRIEDDVIIRENDVEIITKAPKDLIEI